MKIDHDELGSRMKDYEKVEISRKLDVHKPIYARIDGRSFSKLTKGMARPFDARMSEAMIETTKYLVKETSAVIGQTQSDEISLAWYASSYESDIFFSGKIHKMTSVLASMAAAKFNHCLRGWSPFEDRIASFDARVLEMPNKTEAANMFLWRVNDATKNAVSMACRHYYSPKQMHGKSQSEMIAMLAEKNVVFSDYPSYFRFGTFLKRKVFTREMTDQEKIKIPEKFHPEDGMVTRSDIVPIFLDAPFTQTTNRENFIFGVEMP